VATEAAGGGDESFAVFGENLPVDSGLVVVALEIRAAGELDEVLVTDVVLCEQRQVVVELGAAIGVAARIVDAAAPARTLEARLVRHVRLTTDDRRDTRVVRRLVEVEDAVHVAVVGDADRGLPVLHGRRHQLADSRRTVEHRVLGVNMQVGERTGHVAVPGK